MSVKQDTTIKISRENWQRLNSYKKAPGESFDDALTRVLGEDE